MSATDKDYDMVCEQGATLGRLFTVTNADGSAFNLIGYSAKMQVRRQHGKTEALLTASTTTGGLSIVPADGTIKLLVSDEATAGLPAVSAVYDLVITDPAGVSTRLIEGKFIVRAGVTKP